MSLPQYAPCPACGTTTYLNTSGTESGRRKYRKGKCKKCGNTVIIYEDR